MSGASNRRKGNQAETAVVRKLREHGWEAITSRNARGGRQRGTDIVSDFPAAIEVKNQAKLNLAGWWRQAQADAGEQPAVVIHKRVGHSDPGQWWVTLDLNTLIRIVRNIERYGSRVP